VIRSHEKTRNFGNEPYGTRTDKDEHPALLLVLLLERMAGRGRVSLVPRTPFHADFNELLFVSIALTLMEISVDFDHS